MRRVRLFVNREKICDECGHVLADVVSLSEQEVEKLTSELWEVCSSGWRVEKLRELYSTITGEPLAELDDDD